MLTSHGILQWPRTSLTLLYVSWKALIFGLALCSPWPGYDTSTSILYPAQGSWATPFIRWDAVYFTQIAQRGYVFEQEWAFSWGLTHLMRLGAHYLRAATQAQPALAEAWVGIAIAHVAHLVAVQALYGLAMKLFRSAPHRHRLAFTAATLHIVSPAGIFLSAPYAESLFAALQFVGYAAYVSAWMARPQATGSVSQALKLVGAGVSFGLAMLLRSNGILSGLLFTYDAVRLGLQILQGRGSVGLLMQLTATVVAGTCIAAGAGLPQLLAYREYCLPGSSPAAPRPWCSRRIPSIYAFVQAHYWNNGFLRYWTLSNLPLFMLATPTMYMLARSSSWAWFEPRTRSVGADRTLLALLAVPQAVLLVTMFFNSHIQVITRVASGYPVWYLWLAGAIQHPSTGVPGGEGALYLTRWMVVYALIQAGLFASFLPPA